MRAFVLVFFLAFFSFVLVTTVYNIDNLAECKSINKCCKYNEVDLERFGSSKRFGSSERFVLGSFGFRNRN